MRGRDSFAPFVKDIWGLALGKPTGLEHWLRRLFTANRGVP